MTVCDQCMFGLTTHCSQTGEQVPAQKPTKFMSNSDLMLSELGVRCDRSHTHEPLLGGRAAAAETYPLKLVLAILRGMQKTTQAQMAVEEDVDNECDHLISMVVTSSEAKSCDPGVMS